MAGRIKNEDRRWKILDGADLRAGIWHVSPSIGPEEILGKIVEEYPGQREKIREYLLGKRCVALGDVYWGQDFLAICIE